MSSRSHRRVAAILPALAALLALAGCGQGAPGAAGEPVLTVYVSTPLSGPAREPGRDLAAGARLALAEAGPDLADAAVRLRLLDAAPEPGGYAAAAAGANARTASEDSTTIAYVGELDPRMTRTSLPILNEAGILQVAPGGGSRELLRAESFGDDVPEDVQTTGERTYAQLAPAREPGEPPPAPPRVRPEFARHARGELGRAPSLELAYGYEAVASVLAAVERADDPADRGAVVAAYLGARRRNTALGDYEMTATGEPRPLRG